MKKFTVTEIILLIALPVVISIPAIIYMRSRKKAAGEDQAAESDTKKEEEL